MSLAPRRWKAAAAKGRGRRRAAARQHRLNEKDYGRCAMRSPEGQRCPRSADRPGGYCRQCWEAAEKGERA